MANTIKLLKTKHTRAIKFRINDKTKLYLISRLFVLFLQMSFFTRCLKKTKNSHYERNHIREYYQQNFSSGIDLPSTPKVIHPSTILDKQLIVGQFGQPKKAQRMFKKLVCIQEKKNEIIVQEF